MVRTPICSLLLSLVISALVSAQDIQWFNVSNFDVAVVSTPGGQIFPDITGTIDMLATGQAGGVVLVDTGKIVALNDFMTTACFTFAFDEQVDLVMRIESLNHTEFINIGSFGEVDYVHGGGSMPLVSDGVGIEPNVMRLDGADGGGLLAQGEPAYGVVYVGPTHQASWCYTSEADENVEALSLGVEVVPEPAALIIVSSLGLFVFLRRR